MRLSFRTKPRTEEVRGPPVHALQLELVHELPQGAQRVLHSALLSFVEGRPVLVGLRESDDFSLSKRKIWREIERIFGGSRAAIAAFRPVNPVQGEFHPGSKDG